MKELEVGDEINVKLVLVGIDFSDPEEGDDLCPWLFDVKGAPGVLGFWMSGDDIRNADPDREKRYLLDRVAKDTLRLQQLGIGI